MSEVFDQVCEAIRRHHWSMSVIARHSGVSYPTIAAWLNGTRRGALIETLEKVCRALGKRLVLKDGRYVLEPTVGMAPPPRPRARTALWLLQ